MATLLYRGVDAEGRSVCGSRGQATESQLSEALKSRGIVGVEIFESKTAFKRGIYSLVSPKELSIFCKQMSVMFYSDITLMEGVSLLIGQMDNPQLKQALTEVYASMEKGATFANSICMYEHIFTTYLTNMIMIGEASGTLDSVFAQMSVYFDKESKTRKKIKAAVMYPAVLTILMAAVIVLLIVKILPMFGDILKSMGAQTPPATVIILSAGTWLAYRAPIILGLIAVAIISFIVYIRTEKGRYWFDKAKFSIPAYRYVTTRVITSRFSRSLSILLKSGIQLLNAMTEISVLMDNKFIEEKLTEATNKLREGADASEVLDGVGVFPPLFQKMFIIGQKTGNMDEMLDKCAAVFDDEADDAIERFTSMLEPVLIIILSVIVGVILLSVILPMITIMNSIG